tara:strand:+ start:3533 stop:4048 length:516 start_codon:yes stop_codon:yes gene_type:complete
MGKKERFGKVINENGALIFKVASLYTNSKQDREDLYQEIVFQLWKSFDTFSEQAKLTTWMYRVALNTAIYYLKVSKRKVDTISLKKESEGIAEEIDRTEEERIQLLYWHIQKLNLLDKGIILLYLEGKSHQEIAAVIGITVSNVGTRISRIREKLKSTTKEAREVYGQKQN